MNSQLNYTSTNPASKNMNRARCPILKWKQSETYADYFLYRLGYLFFPSILQVKKYLTIQHHHKQPRIQKFFLIKPASKKLLNMFVICQKLIATVQDEYKIVQDEKNHLEPLKCKYSFIRELQYKIVKMNCLFLYIYNFNYIIEVK